MDIALAVFRLATAGGIERDAVRLAGILTARGHGVSIYTTEAGTLGQGLRIETIRRRGLTNHARMASFAADLSAAAGRHDLVVGFHKLPGLDVLFCGDWCFADRDVPAWRRLLPRYQTMVRLERACCGPGSNTLLLMLADPQAEAYRRAWSIPPGRIVVLPPTLDPRRLASPLPDGQREQWRRSLGVGPDTVAWLWLGLQPRVKGLDQAIRALALSPGAHLIVAGADPQKGQVQNALRQAQALGCRKRISTTGRVEDAALRRLFAASDLLVHPARLDVTGTVIVEALGMGLPVVTTENCGYSVHVRASGAGVVLPAAARPEAIAQAAAVSADVRRAWSASALAYVRQTDLTSGLQVAADEIEKRGPRRPSA
jgi:UDP-glucose:(heptosyl)LPS alpha-1,3-glucosyltransferase